METYVIQNKCCGIRYFRGNDKWTDKIELAKRYETYKQAEKAINMMDLFVCESHKIIKIEDKDQEIELLTNRWEKLKEFIETSNEVLLYSINDKPAKLGNKRYNYFERKQLLDKIQELEPKGDE